MANIRWDKFTDKDKVKCMNKMIAYIKKNADTADFVKDNPKDLYSVCRTIGSTTLYDFMAEHVLGED